MSKDPKTPNPEQPGRVFDEHLHDGVGIDDKKKFRHRSSGPAKTRIEHTEGDDLYRDTGKWNKLTRIVDRQADPKMYTERLVDGETGEVIKEVSRSLKQHKGHGSDKKNRK